MAAFKFLNFNRHVRASLKFTLLSGFPKISIKAGHIGDFDVNELKLSCPERRITGFSFFAIIISKKGIETEEKGDRIFESAVEDLFENEKDSIEIIRWNTIFNELENCIDSFENIANTVDEIILKNN